MSILVTGSIAFDHIMVFQDRFKNHILSDKIHMLNVSFLVPELDRLWGGTAANIAYNLRILDLDPVLLGTVGRDFAPYADWMRRHGIRVDEIQVLEDTFTSQAFITTDLDNNQISSFHPGAMERAHEAPVSGVSLPYEVGIVAANGKRAMVEHARELKRAGTPCVIDPGQAFPLFEGKELIELLDGAAVYVVNDYEWHVTLERTGEGEEQIARRVGAIVVTRGGDGSRLRKGALDCPSPMSEESCDVPAVRATEIVDPTGCGDSYRAGLLYALVGRLPLETGARVGGLLGALKIAERGPQSIRLDPVGFRDRYEREFGHPLE
jgi:adenosine kinase